MSVPWVTAPGDWSKTGWQLCEEEWVDFLLSVLEAAGPSSTCLLLAHAAFRVGMPYCLLSRPQSAEVVLVLSEFHANCFIPSQWDLLGVFGVSDIGSGLGLSREKHRTHNLRRSCAVRLALALHGLESIDHLKICTLGNWLACPSSWPYPVKCSKRWALDVETLNTQPHEAEQVISTRVCLS